MKPSAVLSHCKSRAINLVQSNKLIYANQGRISISAGVWSALKVSKRDNQGERGFGCTSVAYLEASTTCLYRKSFNDKLKALHSLTIHRTSQFEFRIDVSWIMTKISHSAKGPLSFGSDLLTVSAFQAHQAAR